MSTHLPALVRELLVERVDSFEKLEIVVALHDAPGTTMSVDALARSLALSRDVVSQAASHLRAASLVELASSGDVRLLSPTTQDQAAVTALVRLYREDRFAVVAVMGELAVERIRGMTSRAFADAFLHKKPKKDGESG